MTKEERILASMKRLASRYRLASGRWPIILNMPEPDLDNLRTWFEDRMEYLQEQYRLAINEQDNIIGKQWLYDQRPRLDE